MNFLIANKKANEYLLKYSIFMIHLDKLESTFNHSGTLYVSLQNCGMVWLELRREKEEQTKVWLFLKIKPSDMKIPAGGSLALLCWRMPTSLNRFSDLSLLGWNKLLFIGYPMWDLLLCCSTINICIIRTWKIHFVDKGPLGSWTRTMQNLKKEKKIEERLVSTEKKYICLVH